MKILVVDDNQDLRDTLRMMLELMGHTCFLASSSGEALQIASRERPDAILLDIGLPDINGFDTCRALRASNIPSSTLIIAHSGSDGLDNRKRASAAGFDNFLIKPVPFDQLDLLLKKLKPA